MNVNDILNDLSSIEKKLCCKNAESFKLLLKGLNAVLSERRSGIQEQDFENLRIFVHILQSYGSECDRLEVYELGVLIYFSLARNFSSTAKAGAKGGLMRSKKYDAVKLFVQEEFFEIVRNNPDIKLIEAAFKISKRMEDKFKPCPLLPTNRLNCLMKWLSNLKKFGKIS